MDKKDEPIADFFNVGALKIFAALDGITPEEEAMRLLEEEKRLRDNKLKDEEQK